MNKLGALWIALATSAGCYATGYGYGSAGYSSGAYVGTTAAVSYSTPPPAVVDVNVDLYHEDRPGYVYINGRHTWTNGQWVWQPGYWETDRPGYVYVQGYWNNNVWVDGQWTAHRPGYVYTGGYWDRRGRGHVWVNGTWERDRGDHVYVRGRWTNDRGVRSYRRGGWEQRSRGPSIRDHRR